MSPQAAGLASGTWHMERTIIAIVGLQRGIPSKRESSARVDYVPALCTQYFFYEEKVSKVSDKCFKQILRDKIPGLWELFPLFPL